MPTLVDSGNGAHVVCPISLPNDNESRDLVKSVLESFATFFSDDVVEVDLTVFNASRIIKVPGTLAMKGDATPSRPHRRSSIIQLGTNGNVVTQEQLSFIATSWKSGNHDEKVNKSDPPFELQEFLDRHGTQIRSSLPWNNGVKHILKECVFDQSHTGTSAVVIQLSSGGIAYKCQHASCARYQWKDVQAKFDPDYHDTHSTSSGAHPDSSAFESLLKKCEKQKKTKLTRDDRRKIFSENAKDIDGDRMLDALVDALLIYLVLKDGKNAASILALWIVHTYVFDAFDFTPYIAVIGPDKRCAKTLVQEILWWFSASPIKTSNITPAAIFRVITLEAPTLFLDEIDRIFTRNKSDSEMKENLIGILNSGFQQGAYVVRCSGKEFTPQRFEVFGPKCFAGIKSSSLPDTIRDRSIVIRMARATQNELKSIKKFRPRDIKKEAGKMRVECADWAAYHYEELRNARPSLIPAIDDPRTEDIIEPLLAIADAAGGHWPRTARAALLVLCEKEPEEDSEGVKILRGCRRIFEELGAKFVATEILLQRLNQDENVPLLGEGPRKLAAVLHEYDIRVQRTSQKRGYLRAHFEEP